MKQFLLLSLTAWLGMATQSCESAESSLTTTDQDITIVASAKGDAPVVLLANSSTPSDPDTTNNNPVHIDEDSVQHLACIHHLRQIDESSIEPSEVVVELPKFVGNAISESSALLFLINQDTLKLYVDYFEGDIKGSKVFYIAAGELLGVDVMAMEKQWTEGGEQMNSVLTHSFYYRDKELLCCQNHYYPEQQALLQEENEKDWRNIRRSLQIL